MKRFLASILFALALVASANAQDYPAQCTISGAAQACAVTTYGTSSARFALSGTFSGLSGSLQGLVAGSTSWQGIPYATEGGNFPQLNVASVAITAAGIYDVNTAGYSQVRFIANALSSGSVGVLAEASSGSLAYLQPGVFNSGALITLTAQGAGTVNSTDQINSASHGLKCVFTQTSHTGTPSTTFAIQGKDASSGLYITYVTSAAISADNTPTPLTVYPGITSTANVSASDVLMRTWRATATVGGTTPSVNAIVDCDEIP